MNREDAIKVLKSLAECLSIDCDDDCEHCHIQLDGITAVVEACAVAVTELSQPDTDMVSRQFMHDLGATCIARRDKGDNLVAILNIDLLTPASESNAQKALDDDCQQTQSVECIEDDTISRGAAIEAVKNALDPGIVSFMKARRAILNLPPSQLIQPPVQPDRKNVDGYLFNLYRNGLSLIGPESVVSREYWIKQLYEAIFGKGERPVWMRKDEEQ